MRLLPKRGNGRGGGRADLKEEKRRRRKRRIPSGRFLPPPCLRGETPK